MGKHTGLFTALALIVLLPGCATQRTRPASLEPGKTVVLPVLDLRQDQRDGMDVSGLLNNSYMANRFKRKGYRVVWITDASIVAHINADALDAEDMRWMRVLGPRDTRWVLLIALEDVRHVRRLDSAFRAHCTGILFDKSTAKVVWRLAMGHRELAAGDAPAALWRSAVAQGCFRRLIQALPNQQ